MRVLLITRTGAWHFGLNNINYCEQQMDIRQKDVIAKPFVQNKNHNTIYDSSIMVLTVPNQKQTIFKRMDWKYWLQKGFWRGKITERCQMIRGTSSGSRVLWTNNMWEKCKGIIFSKEKSKIIRGVVIRTKTRPINMHSISNKIVKNMTAETLM